MRPWLRRTLFGALGATTLLGGGVALSGWSDGHGGGWHRSWTDDDTARFSAQASRRIAERLQLDAAQRARLDVLLQRLREQHAALRGAGDLPRQLQALVQDAHFDRWHAQDLVDVRLLAVREHAPRVIAAAADFYDGLNAEQQRQVREFVAERRGWHRPRG